MYNIKNKQKTPFFSIFLFILLILFIIIFLSSCETTDEKEIEKEDEKGLGISDIILTTADEINLSATYKETPYTDKAVLLLHMLGKDKNDYQNLTLYLQKNSFTVLAIDFRGHGNSELDYKSFTDADWQDLVLDVEAGVDYLESKGYKKIAVIGASIGANAGLKHAVQDDRIDLVVLLSAGEEYRGINILELAPFYKKPVLVVASMDDKEAAVAATRIYNALGTEYKEIKMYPTGGHGTRLLETQDGLPAVIATWLQGYD